MIIIPLLNLVILLEYVWNKIHMNGRNLINNDKNTNKTISVLSSLSAFWTLFKKFAKINHLSFLLIEENIIKEKNYFVTNISYNKS